MIIMISTTSCQELRHDDQHDNDPHHQHEHHPHEVHRDDQQDQQGHLPPVVKNWAFEDFLSPHTGVVVAVLASNKQLWVKRDSLWITQDHDHDHHGDGITITITT